MRDLAIIGLGELGQLFGAAALRAGIRVTPVTRGMSSAERLRELEHHTPVLVAVGEADLEAVLEQLPSERKGSLILLQNELFPAQWERHDSSPTVLVPWMLKKKGQPLLVARSTPVFGQYSELVRELHRAAGLSAETLPTRAALLTAIVEKYAFILTVNALGLLRDTTLGVWLVADPALIAELSREAAQLGGRLCGAEQDESAVAEVVAKGMHALSGMRARGRTAQERVDRALGLASQFGLSAPALRRASGKV
jgi:hypothetical protein